MLNIQLLLLVLSAFMATSLAEMRPKVILDVDPGVDDAQAMLMMLKATDENDILALTISQGNTFLSNATHNALRVLRLCDKLNIPIFLGDIYTIDGKVKNTSVYFGPNGFGNIPDDTFDYSRYMRQPENASQAIIRLVKTFPYEVTIITLGTQTNIARVMKADPEFAKYVKELIVMGGNYLGIGNETPKAEFNFLIDPVAADMMVRELACPITIITWELCLNHSVSWEWYDSLVSKDTIKAKFLKEIGQFGRDRAISDQQESYVFADQIAAAVFLDRSVIKKSQLIDARVETQNASNIGEMIVNWNSDKPKKWLMLVTEIDVEIVKELLMNSVDD